MYFIKCLLNVANFHEHEHELEFQVTFLSLEMIETNILIIKNIIKKGFIIMQLTNLIRNQIIKLRIKIV